MTTSEQINDATQTRFLGTNDPTPPWYKAGLTQTRFMPESEKKPDLLEKKKVVIILGPESSGTRNIARLLVKSGFVGESLQGAPKFMHEHGQYDDFDLFKKEQPEKVIFRRSVPHDYEWVDICAIVNFFKEASYFVSCIVTLRDWNCMATSQVNANHVRTVYEAKANIRKSYFHIFNGLNKAGIEYVPLSYESLIQYPTQTLRMLGVELNINFSFSDEHGIRDENAKYYSKFDIKRMLLSNESSWTEMTLKFSHKKKFYCTRAFEHMQLLENGNITPCCPPWVNHYTIGNIKEQSYEEIWNGEKAQEFRKSILDGSFKYCNKKSCPLLSNPDLRSFDSGLVTEDKLHTIKRDNIRNDILDKKTILDHGPTEVQFCYDRSCNLSCPSCRREVIMVSGEKKKKILDMQDKFQSNYLHDAKDIVITGSGDAFGSYIFRTFLQTLVPEQAPNLGFIMILTNGLLLKRYWDTLSPFAREKIGRINFSIDAATEETYLVNRRGGDWKLLHENLEFVQHLLSTKQISSFGASMVVQDNNYREIKDFVKMCRSYGVCCVDLQIIEPDFIKDLKHEYYFEEWFSKAVHEKKHKNHEELLRVIKDPWFDKYVDADPIEMYMGPLMTLREGRDISQYENNLREYNHINRRLSREIGIKTVPYKLVDKEQNKWEKADE